MAGIYIHIPFCNTKCIYCDFYSITDHSKKNEIIDSIIKEISFRSSQLKDKKFETIFFGGGTPSLLSVSDFKKMFEALYANLNISHNPEITIEANPGTMNRKKLKDFKQNLPINRISFGVQSFNDDDLKYLSRIHTSAKAEESIKTAQDVGYDNINLDLIFAIPGQTKEKWIYNLQKAVDLNTKHISAYSLIFEEGTPLFNMYMKKKAIPQTGDAERKLYDLTMSFLKDAGYNQYEISNYAKEGFECRHNLKYWSHDEYISFGPSAASYINRYRWVNVKDIDKYIGQINSGTAAYDFMEFIDEQKSLDEYIMLGLRSKGINLLTLKQKYNTDFHAKYNVTCGILIKNKLARLKNNIFSLTPRGYAICDEILASYF
jgi:oxygen-independent coproporphyrinogen-3 oxidase